MNPEFDALLPWYRQHRRDLPWRRRTDPYAIWVSEIMLQQTGVSTVIPYFERWMDRFPSVEQLAVADEQEVLGLWQGLCYYRRCRNLLAGAGRVAEVGWPQSATEWLAIPGVGKYTAGAISSITMNEAVPLVDGNIERVYARLTGDSSAGPALNSRSWTWAACELRAEAPGDWNQALMELGATVCTPLKPKCELCPVSNACAAKRLRKTAELPTKSVKPSVKKLAFQVSIFHCNGRFGLRQIPEGEWWAGMWEFPRAPLAVVPPEKAALIHTVTNHRISLYPLVTEVPTECPELQWFTTQELASKPLPAPQRKLLKLILSNPQV